MATRSGVDVIGFILGVLPFVMQKVSSELQLQEGEVGLLLVGLHDAQNILVSRLDLFPQPQPLILGYLCVQTQLRRHLSKSMSISVSLFFCALECASRTMFLLLIMYSLLLFIITNHWSY